MKNKKTMNYVVMVKIKFETIAQKKNKEALNAQKEAFKKWYRIKKAIKLEFVI